MEIENYLSKEEFQKIKDFSDTKRTPCLVINLDKVRRNYIDLKKDFSNSDIYYAVKANPEREIIKLLNSLGSFFDVASVYELDMLLETGVKPEKMSYGNTIKKSSDIIYAYEKGIRLFVTDS
jgi:ornithine decarboxylase